MIRSRKSHIDAEEAAVPDSTTTIEKDRQAFSPGQDVFLKHRDGRYYLGTVVEVDCVREQCLVKFGDNTESWSNFKDLSKLSTAEEDLLCVICKKSAPKSKHEITICDKCGRGYHQKCHQPEIPFHCQKEDSAWICRRCLDHEPIRQRRSTDFKHLRKDSLRKNCSGTTDITSTPNSGRTFPYDIHSLKWDTYHRENTDHIYCYCGGYGKWYNQMLQCGRCRQWFHDKCVSCLQYPLYCGDRFYVFVCSICNHGTEFLRRLELKWVDLVHLMVYNLTTFNTKKYYDLDTVILPYINDNWHALQLPPKIFNVSKSERRENILSVLTNNRNRFKCGREIKKKTTIWGLRVLLPPPAHCATLPNVGVISEEELRERWQGNRRLQFLPLPESKRVVGEDGKLPKIVPVDNHMLNIMMGTAYQENNALSDSDSSCTSSERQNEDQKFADSKTFTKNEYEGGGCVKKSASFPKHPSVQVKKEMRKRLNGRLETIKREPLEDENKRLSLDSKSSKNSETLPLTPPTSVSAPPTPPAVSSNNSSETNSVFAEHTANLAQNLSALNKGVNSKLIKTDLMDGSIDRSLELNTPCSSGDETSSKSTLDLIIPPPKDFKGQNNPFLTLFSGTIIEDPSKKKRNKDTITLPLPLTAVIPGKPIVRTMKRQLSEKDICIGPNGEVKRRRLRRSRTSQGSATYPTAPTASKTAAVVPARPENLGSRSLRSSLSNSSNQSQIGNCVDYALNGRRLRQRHDKTQEKEKTPSNPPTPKPSPVKQEPDISMDDLKSSVNSYFGAATRIAAGERFSVKAKRIGPTGKIQYLIEWEGPSNGMT